MNRILIESALKARKAKFLHFRWLLFIWLGALAGLRAGTQSALGQEAYGLFAVFVATQAALWALKPKYYDGMKVLNAIFLLDLNFVLFGIYASNQLRPELLVALFLGTFMAALSRSLAQSVGTTVVIIATYLGYKLQSPQGFHFGDPSELLQLPFLFISSVHSSLLAQEAGAELSARQVLAQDKHRLSRQMSSTFVEFARQCKDMSALVDALPFGAVMLDGTGGVRVCNGIAEEIFGTNSAEFIGMPMGSHPQLSALKPYLDRAADEPLSDFIFAELPAKDGGTWTLNLGVYPVREQEESRGLLIVMIPQGFGDSLTESLPRPLITPAEAKPILQDAGVVERKGLSLVELGLSYG